MEMTYSTSTLADLYHGWSKGKAWVPEVEMSYLGDLTGATVVDFGCGQGPFLKLCLEKGASYCLGLDLNQAMINKAMQDPQIEKYVSDGKLKLIVQDCMQPIADHLGPFDFAVSQYVLHHCSNEEDLATYYKNISQMLKPSGQVMISMSPPLATREEQESIAISGRVVVPLKSDSGGQDPWLGHISCLHEIEEVKEGKVGMKDELFYISNWYWSKEKLMEKLQAAGFENVHLFKPSGLEECENFEFINSLIEPYIFIVGEKHH